MIKQTPRPSRLVLMALFTLSCFGILLYLWITFGGSSPLKPEGYRFHAQFRNATQLAQQADVRISGVNVGKVVKTEENHTSGLTDTTIEMKRRFAPIPRNTRAILRQKTLLGETFVELTPGQKSSGRLADGGSLARSRVSPTVELDQIFRTFDPRTRVKFSQWLTDQGAAVGNRGQDLNDALGTLTPFAQETDDVLRVVRAQSGDTRSLVRNTGVVFDALSERRGQLRGLISNSNRVFETTAARDRRLQETFVAFPTFLRQSRSTVRRLSQFSEDANPLITQLRPAARELSPTLIDLRSLAPDLRGLLRDLGPLIRVSRRGLPALTRVLDETRPFLARLDPYLRSLQPITDYLGLYKREIASFFANDASATQVENQLEGAPRSIHYLRAELMISPESLAAFPKRLATTRSNAYPQPGWGKQLARGLDVFGSYLCGGGTDVRLSPATPTRLKNLVNEFAFTDKWPVRPPCHGQAPLGRKVGQTGAYPHLVPLR